MNGQVSLRVNADERVQFDATKHDEYIAHMSHAGTTATNIEVAAAARLYRRPIELHTSHKTSYRIEPEEQDSAAEAIRLLLLDEQYYLLRPNNLGHAAS